MFGISTHGVEQHSHGTRTKARRNICIRVSFDKD